MAKRKAAMAMHPGGVASTKNMQAMMKQHVGGQKGTKKAVVVPAFKKKEA